MIIEMCGPPGAGKSTLARALVARLEARGLPVALAASFRPAEVTGGSRAGGVGDALHRLLRPARELLVPSRRGLAAASRLLDLQAPTSLLWRVRLRQYLWRLGTLWQVAARDGRVWVFDQAFVQAIGSLLVLGRSADDAHVAALLAAAPAPDLLVAIAAPEGVLRARLEARARRQRRMERALELDLAANLGFVAALDRVLAAAAVRGMAPCAVGGTDAAALADAVARAEAAAMGRLPTRRAA